MEDALAALKSNNEQAVLSDESVRESQNAYDIAKARFDAGAVDYLNLLETQRSLYQAQDNQVSIMQGQLASFIQPPQSAGYMKLFEESWEKQGDFCRLPSLSQL